MDGQTFEIGLVGAGAVSAGAYTGGVIDFMVQALDCWYAAKDAGREAPPHDVKISVFSGASAGSITAALATGFLASDQPPVVNPRQGRSGQGKNTLFDSWVERIDISNLLETKDLRDRKSPVMSLLDSTALMDIANTGLDVTPRAKRRPYLGENFELLLTVTNLRGVPYAFEVTGQDAETYDMSLHADYMHFRINDTGADSLPDRYTMAWKDFGTSSATKEQLKLAALASGAFPVGLAPRTLRHVIPGPGKPDWYSARTWPIPTPESAGPHRCVTNEPIPARWRKIPENYPFEFQCVDGGVMNNEPFELARKHLAGVEGRNKRDGESADRAVLLIDPFPSEVTFEPDFKASPDLVKIALSLFDALKNQARFKPEELMLAADEDVYSRFMIAPSREGAAYPIACGALGGFGGFLHRSFREHDYFLGRRNAQKFLHDHFVLPETNPLFAAWTEDMKAAHRSSMLSTTGQRQLPIIPLVGDATVECGATPWPGYTAENLARLEKQIEHRVDVVVDRLVSQYFEGHHPIVRLIAGWVLARKKKDIVDFARARVAGELKKMALMN